MHRGGKTGKKVIIAQEKPAGEEEEENGVSEMVESTGDEGREPTLSDMMGILRAHMHQQEAREVKQTEVTARQEQRFKALHHQFQLLQLEVQARTSPVLDPQLADSDSAELGAHFSSTPPSQARVEPLATSPTMAPDFQLHTHHTPRLEKLTDTDDIEHFLITFERIAVACRWQKAEWVFHLIPLLTGKARSAYVHMDIDDSLDYEQVKSSILAKYDINPETYRLRFRSLEVNP